MITVSFEGPGTQRRWTIAFRIILAIPAALWLWLLGIAVQVVVLIGWFAALFTGRLPDGMAKFVAQYLQLNARFYAYAQYLLTDKYPPFALDAPDYAVNVEVPPTRLNRLAVLFRLILAIPAYLLYALVAVGMQIAAIVIWLVVLIMGRLPAPLFEAEAAVLRYQVRFWGYLMLLTGTYPADLFGDQADAPNAAPPEFLPARPRITRLVLSAAARRLVVLFIALGVVIGGGGFAVVAVNAARTQDALDELATHGDELLDANQRFGQETQGCAISGGLDCLHSADRKMAAAFEKFDRQIDAIRFPALIEGDVEQLRDDVADVIASLHELESINSQAEYQAAFAEFQRNISHFAADYNALVGF
jgi:hypothetical protein